MYVHPGSSTGSSNVEDEEKHSTSASAAAEAARKLPRASQRTPNRPKHASSIRVDIGLFCLKIVETILWWLSFVSNVSKLKIA